MSRYISDTPHQKTILGIEAVVEWIEARNRPFTNHEAFHGARIASYSTTYRTIRDLEHYGLIVRVNARNAKPARWITIDHKEQL